MIHSYCDYAVGKSNTDGDIEVIDFTKDMPYILDLIVYRYDFEQIKNISKGMQFLKLKKVIQLLYI